MHSLSHFQANLDRIRREQEATIKALSVAQEELINSRQEVARNQAFLQALKDQATLALARATTETENSQKVISDLRSLVLLWDKQRDRFLGMLTDTENQLQIASEELQSTMSVKMSLNERIEQENAAKEGLERFITVFSSLLAEKKQELNEIIAQSDQRDLETQAALDSAKKKEEEAEFQLKLLKRAKAKAERTKLSRYYPPERGE